MQSGYALTVSKLRHLVVVAELLNLTRAAEKLNISQPALSRSIISLERAYGFAIFDRRSSGLALTNVGKSVVEEARKVIERIRSFDHSLRLYGTGEQGNVAFGIAPQLASLLLPEVLRDLMGKAANISATTLIRPTENLIAALRHDEIDFCFVAEEKLQSHGLIFDPIGRMSAGFFVRGNHPLIGTQNLTLSDIADYTVGCSTSIRVPELYSDEIDIFICDNYDILRRITVQSDMVCLCAKSFAKIDNHGVELFEIPVEGMGHINNPICLVSLEGRLLSPMDDRIISSVKKALSYSSLSP